MTECNSSDRITELICKIKKLMSTTDQSSTSSKSSKSSTLSKSKSLSNKQKLSKLNHELDSLKKQKSKRVVKSIETWL